MRRAGPRAAALLALLAAPAAADERYIGVFVGSQHIGSDAYNDVNPGLTYGRRWAVGPGPVELHAEGGVFYNSYEEVSPIALAGVSTRVAEVGPGEVRVGASAGLAYYGELSDALEARYGISGVGGVLPIGAVTLAYRAGRTEVRLNVVPYGDDVTAVVNLSLAVAF